MYDKLKTYYLLTMDIIKNKYRMNIKKIVFELKKINLNKTEIKEIITKNKRKINKKK